MESIWVILLIGVVLSLDAFAVSVTNGIVESKMRMKKVLLVAFFYGLFQFAMPVIGYYASSLLEEFIAKFSHWVSFILLLLVGGKMAIDSIKEMSSANKEDGEKAGEAKPLTIGKLTLQSIATSIDALAVGVTMLACDSAGELFMNVWIDSAIIGATTFLLCFIALQLGKYAGSKIKVPATASLVGGIILVLLGAKILLQGLGVISLPF